MRRKRLCCSKKMVLTSYVTTILLTVILLGGTFFTPLDMSPIAAVSALAWTETTAANAFYFWKAKNENRIKLTNQMIRELADKYGIDAVVNLAGIVIKD